MGGTLGWASAQLGLVLVGLLGSTGLGRADTVALVYERGVGAASCPDEAELRRAVASRIGRDPFAGGPAPWTVKIAIARAGTGMAGRIELRDPTGALAGMRLLEDRRCDELLAALAVSIGLALDRLQRDRMTPGRNDSSLLVVSAQGTASRRSDRAAAVDLRRSAHSLRRTPNSDGPRTPLALRMSVTGVVAAGYQPRTTGALHAGLGVRSGALSVTAEARLAPGTQVRFASGEGATTGRIAAAIAPCSRVGPLLGCAVIEGAKLTARGFGVDEPREGSAWTAAVGVAAAWEWHVGGPFSLQARGEVAAPILAGELLIDDRPVWSAPPLQGAVGLALILEAGGGQ